MISASQQAHVEHLFQGYLDYDGSFEYTPALLHADLSGDHIFSTADGWDIAGIIDFGDIRIGDPVYDLMYLYQDYGTEFIDDLVGYFSRKHFANIQPKLQFFNVCNTIEDILHWGLDRGDDRVVREALEKLDEQAAQHPIGFH